MDAAKKELAKITPSKSDKASVTKATSHLDEGMKCIEVCQKHIKVADRSEFGWSVISIYESDKLTDNSDDEKRLFKAEKEAERIRNKKKRASAAVGARKHTATGTEALLKAATNGPVGARLPTPRSRPLGPCFRCSEFGHLAAKLRQTYPFDQPVVREAVDSSVCVLSKGVNESVYDCKAVLVLSGKAAESAAQTGVDNSIPMMQ